MTKEEALKAWSDAYQEWVGAYVKAEAKRMTNEGQPASPSSDAATEQAEFSTEVATLARRVDRLAIDCSPVQESMGFVHTVAKKIRGKYSLERIYRAIGVAMAKGPGHVDSIADLATMELEKEDKDAAVAEAAREEEQSLIDSLQLPPTAAQPPVKPPGSKQ